MNKWLIALLGALTVLLGLLAFLPAGLVWAWVKDDAQAAVPELAVHGLDGSVWQGSATVQARPYPPVNVEWRLSPWGLLIGRLSVQLEGAGQGLAFTGGAWASIGARAALSLPSAQMHADFINAQTRRYGLALSETFAVQGFQVRLAPTGPDSEAPYWPTALAGQVSWPGGSIELETPAGMAYPRLPPLLGEVAMQGQAITLRMSSQGQPALDIALKPDGWAVMQVRGLLVQLLALPLPQGGDGLGEADVVYIYEEKIL